MTIDRGLMHLQREAAFCGDGGRTSRYVDGLERERGTLKPYLEDGVAS
jgi:hypothetical protein